LQLKDRFNEYLMTNLRRSEGVSPAFIESHFGYDFRQFFGKELQQIDPELYREEDGRIVLTRKGKLLADRITSALFYVEV
jgi:coproporphyrinogen III oxidase-like Fe-S oxidoreductase